MYLNIYELNPMLELLNRFVLRKNQMGIFHCGVQVHLTEFSFVFLADVCNDERSSSETGVRQYTPKWCPPYKFSESIDVGWTEFSMERTKCLVSSLAVEWQAHSYHITRRNCLLFAEALIDALGLREQFPEWLKNASEVAMQSPGLASFVDSYWTCARWCLTTGRSALDYKPLKCCARENETAICSLSHVQIGRCCPETSGDVETVLRRDIVQEDMVNTDELAFQVSNRVQSCEYDAVTLCNSGWTRKAKRRASCCGVSICADGSQCVVHSFTRIGVGKAEVCFEFIQTVGRTAEEPKNSRLLWDGGSLQAAKQTVLRDSTHQTCSTAGILLYEGVPDGMLDGQKEIEFQYGSYEYSPILLRATRKHAINAFTI